MVTGERSQKKNCLEIVSFFFFFLQTFFVFFFITTIKLVSHSMASPWSNELSSGVFVLLVGGA